MAKVAVITGASAGIGLACAKRLQQGGYEICNLARHPDPDDAFWHIPTDVANEASVQAAFAAISDRYGTIDLLVNNAGIGISGAVEFADTDDIKRLFEVNVFGQIHCAQAAIPLLRERKGRIIHISSVAALFSLPYQAAYSAGKRATNAFSLALDNELRRFGIRSIAIMPGDVRSNFPNARRENHEGNALYGGSINRSVSAMVRDERNGMAPERIAQAVFRAATTRNPKPLRTVGAKYKCFALLYKLLPTRLINRIVGALYIR